MKKMFLAVSFSAVSFCGTQESGKKNIKKTTKKSSKNSAERLELQKSTEIILEISQALRSKNKALLEILGQLKEINTKYQN